MLTHRVSTSPVHRDPLTTLRHTLTFPIFGAVLAPARSAAPDSLLDARLSGPGARGRRVLVMVAFVGLLALADLAFTLWAHFFTPFHELNPIARGFLERGQINLLIGCKLLVTLIGIMIFYMLRRHRAAELASLFAFVTYVVLTLRWHAYIVAIVAMP